MRRGWGGSVSEWDVWHAFDFRDLAAPGLGLALKYRQQAGRDGKGDRRVWKSEGRVALSSFKQTVQLSIFFFLQATQLQSWFHSNWQEWPVVVPGKHFTLDGWWRGLEERWLDGWGIRPRGLAKCAEPKWCRGRHHGTSNQNQSIPIKLTASTGLSITKPIFIYFRLGCAIPWIAPWIAWIFHKLRVIKKQFK